MSHRADNAVPATSTRSRGRDATFLTLVPGLVLAATILAAYAWWGRTTQPSLEPQRASAWATFASVLVFAAFAMNARRWIVLPVAAFGALALGIAHACAVVHPVRLFYATDQESKVDLARTRLAELDRQAQDVALWRAGGLPPRSIPYRDSGSNPLFVPGLPIGVPIHGSTFGVASYDGPIGSNRRGWEAYGAGLASALPTKRAALEAELGASQAGFAAPLRDAADEARLWAEESIGLAVVLLAFNGFALLFGGSGRRNGTATVKQQARAMRT